MKPVQELGLQGLKRIFKGFDLSSEGQVHRADGSSRLDEVG